MSNRSHTPFSAPTDANRNKVVLGVLASDGITPAPLEIDGSGNLLVNSSGGGGGGDTSSNIRVGQQTSNTSAVQLTSSSATLTNGLIIQALATNTANVYIGGASVTTSTGFELQPGQATSIAISNQNLMYVIGSNGTDRVCWIGN